jgi:hypothetical protein
VKRGDFSLIFGAYIDDGVQCSFGHEERPYGVERIVEQASERTMNEHDQPTPRTMKIIVFSPTPLLLLVDLEYNVDWIFIASASRVNVDGDSSPSLKLCRRMRAGAMMARNRVWIGEVKY